MAHIDQAFALVNVPVFPISGVESQEADQVLILSFFVSEYVEMVCIFLLNVADQTDLFRVLEVEDDEHVQSVNGHLNVLGLEVGLVSNFFFQGVVILFLKDVVGLEEQV